ncbi:MAG: dihydroorotate dehydrogenase electron transfer subunit [Lachnospiraceae bacterium]|nr:dihydroorotate dehydrogenase electron transfer subunit [Lachnospiraceae bacterium]
MIKELATVLSQERIAAGIYSLVLRVSFAEEVLPGQFVSLYSRDASRLLPRPISICESSSEEGTIRLVYRIAGAGTSEFSKLIAGEKIEVLGPLGNGFPVKEYAECRVLLVGGGIGIPPLLSCARKLTNKTFAVGYRSETYLLPDLESEADVHVATEDGSLGTPGNVIDAIKADDVKADVIFSCGPKPMLRALKAYAAEIGIPCYVSMEERMACGIGACLACVCRTTGIDGHSHVHNTRICKDGPVFLAEEVDLT